MASAEIWDDVGEQLGWSVEDEKGFDQWLQRVPLQRLLRTLYQSYGIWKSGRASADAK